METSFKLFAVLFPHRGHVDGNRHILEAVRLSGADTRFSLHARHLRSLVVQHPTEWSTKTDQSINRWEALWKYPFGQPKQEVESEIVPHIQNLQWWDDAGLEGIDPKELWFFHPVRFLEQIKCLDVPFLFPLSFPVESYREGKAGSYGYGRKTKSGGTRSHAGCDRYAPRGTEIHAVKDGVVVGDLQYFDIGTWQIVIDHEDFLCRYTEIENKRAPDIAKGAFVKQGQIIGYVGLTTVTSQPMLHFEMYDLQLNGKVLTTSANAFLTDTSNTSKRVSSLINPTQFLDSAKYK